MPLRRAAPKEIPLVRADNREGMRAPGIPRASMDYNAKISIATTSSSTTIWSSSPPKARST
jgi:hypothetical protein